ncbi:MAG TPA: hypothetical protein VH601_00235 [Bryobacteraceae bacterium]|jgi:hypothetical protein
MQKLWIAVIFAAACAASEQPAQILEAIRQNVIKQLSKSANYTCTEALERSYYRNNGFAMAIHGPEAVAIPKNQLLHDRLRLDVAVSGGKEIYAWHGAGRFSASEVTDIVRRGPISTGQFIGYLSNVFLVAGVSFKYGGKISEGGLDYYRFDFDVPLSASKSQVHASSGYQKVPFHGSFTVRASTLQLATLEVIDAEIPPETNLQSVRTELRYQVARISGRDALIPASFKLQIQDNARVFTVSRGDYSDCREFGSESTLRFAANDPSAQSEASAPPSEEQPLPAGLSLRVALKTEIKDETAWAGDTVEGVLMHAVQIPGSEQTIPKNAVLRGIITRFVTYFEPEKQYDLRIEFRQLAFANRTYRLQALHEPTSADLFPVYGIAVPERILKELRAGSMLIHSKHVRLDKNFTAVWKTVPLDGPG